MIRRNIVSTMAALITLITSVVGSGFADVSPNLKYGVEEVSVTRMSADEPALIKATLFSHTNNGTRIHDNCVFATVKTADRQTIIAHAANRDCLGSDNTECNVGRLTVEPLTFVLHKKYLSALSLLM